MYEDATSLIDFSKMTVSSAFNLKHYIVPAYQREYVWEDDAAVEQFIIDIWNAFTTAPDKPYFIGSMVTYKYDENRLELIDGQQRMTTLFILLCVLYHIYQNNGLESDTLKNLISTTWMDDNGEDIHDLAMQLQYEETNDVLENIWLKQIPSADKQEGLTPSAKRLYAAYEALLKYLGNATSDFNDIKKFVSYLLQKVLFIQISTLDIADALKIFETINERGEGLNPLDLLKNMIFSNVEREDFERLNADWKKMIDKINDIGEKPLRFLRYYLTANYDVSNKGKYGILPEDKIYKWISSHDDQCHYKDKPFEFVKSMYDSVCKYASYLNPEGNDTESTYLKDIPLIAGKSSRLHLVLLLAANQMDTSTRESFVKVLELLAYYAAVNRIKSNRIEPLYAEWCGSIRNISNEKELSVFLKEAVAPVLARWNDNYHANFNALNWDSLQQYRMKYILARLTKYIDEKKANRSDVAFVEKYVASDVPIEHIMPQDLKTEEEFASYDMNEDEYNIYKRKYGNLTLLETTINSSIKDKPYDKKCEQYPNSSYYLSASLPRVIKIGVNTAQERVNSKLKEWAGIPDDTDVMWDKWDKNSIDSRQEMLYRLSEEVWNIDEILQGLNH